MFIAAQFAKKLSSEKNRTPGSILIKQKKAFLILAE
jgi:hypothetical protein